MIIIDFSQIAYAALHAVAVQGKVDESFLRHLVLNSILHVQRKHSHKYGKEIVLACDNHHCWRRDCFPAYKYERRQGKTKDEFDWDAIHASLNHIQQEIKDHFRYIVVNVYGAEGDDVIAVLANHAYFSCADPEPNEFGGLVLDSERSQQAIHYPTLIVSSDKDYGQLGHIADQYDPKKKVFITSTDPDASLRQLILKGDVADGVPNILSDDDVFMVKSKKQKSITAKKMLEWNAMSDQLLRDSDPIIDRNWPRNNRLVNLRSGTPIGIVSDIKKQYFEQQDKKANGLMDYFFKNHLHKLMADIQEFQ